MTRLTDRAACFLPALLAVLLFFPVIHGDFLADDFGYIQLYARTSLADFPRLFAGDWSQGIWEIPLPELRPLVGLTYFLEYRLWGTNPVGYHVTNLALYVVLVAGFVRLVSETAWHFVGARIGERAVSWWAAVAGLVFALHPANVEPVAWIAGRTDLLGANAYVWALGALAWAWRTQLCSASLAM